MIDLSQTEPITMPAQTIVAQSPKCASGEGDEIVICGRADQEQFRLRPLPPLKREQGILEKPLVIKLGPNVKVGLLGNGLGMKVEF